jgi:PAS domain-containing protein
MLTFGRPDEAEARLRRFDGSYRWFLFRTEALRDERGAVVGWYGTNTDIEDRKRAESALQRSEVHSAEAQKLSLTGSIAWDLVGSEHFWSDQAYQILGFDRSVRPSMDLMIQRVHPDDRAHLRHEADRAAKALETSTMNSGFSRWAITHLHVRAHRMEFERQGGTVGALTDTTEAKKSQEALQAAQSALAHASRVVTLEK